jgi:hypothetical protein
MKVHSHRFAYNVVGRGAFPFDMLRYDCAWPATSLDAGMLGPTVPDTSRSWRTIRLYSCREPTVDRWRSFGWTVKDS